ncbi:hydrogenase expression/formation protein HypE [Chitinophaga sp.]|uniref:hydrogenase expression/formation protein HypE n=1 Tax=Chitinophaga sp. TaxID=1869181 RepID=UPI0031CDCEED
MQLTCPLPSTGVGEIITLGHGSGGLMTHQLLQTEVFDLLHNDWLDQQHDGATFSLNGKVAFSTDSYVVSPLFFPGGNIGDLAINGTVNDLAMCGAMARYLSLSFIIEEGLEIALFRKVLQHIKEAAQAAGVAIVTGDTKVVERGKGDQLFINTSGIGHIHPRAQIHHNRIVPGDVVIVSGEIAAHGMAIMSVRKGLEFETEVCSDTRPLHAMVAKLLDCFGEQIKFLRDPTRGGLASVLNEMTEATKLGVMMDENSLPVNEQVAAACEMLGLDPLYVANEGIMVAIVSAAVAPSLLAALHQIKGGEQAAIIGKVTKEHAGKVVLESRIGGHRVVNFLPGEQLPRIC